MKHLPEIILKAIDHKKHRYITCGDYYQIGKKWKIITSRMNADMEFLVLIHELVEWYLTQQRGIKEPDIKAFDEKFENERDMGKWKDEEPGDDLRAPYFQEHQFATRIEKQICDELGIDWDKYEKTCLELFE
jgi:hypothetical protein